MAFVVCCRIWMLKTVQAVTVSVKVVVVDMLEYSVRLSVIVTVWVPIVAALVVETEISPAEVIDTSLEVNAV